MHLTPPYLSALPHRGVDLRGRHLVVAGDRRGPGLAQQAAAAGARTSHYYGSAELSFVAWGRDATDLRPFPGVEVEIRAGKICARSSYLCVGYLGEPGPARRDGAGFASVSDRGSWSGERLQVDGRGDVAVTTGAPPCFSPTSNRFCERLHRATWWLSAFPTWTWGRCWQRC